MRRLPVAHARFPGKAMLHSEPELLLYMCMNAQREIDYPADKLNQVTTHA